MATLVEGNLELTIPNAVATRKFDDSSHGLTHCMKAVDFIVELTDRFLFIEFKDPEHPAGKPQDKAKFVGQFLAGSIDEEFKYKYRDSFLYEWACGRARKPIHYLVLVALASLTEADLLMRTDELKRKLPLHGPASGLWQHQIVASCAVFNIATWNKHLASYPVARANR